MISTTAGKHLLRYLLPCFLGLARFSSAADHGNMAGDLNRWFKGAMDEGSARIPRLMKAPVASGFAATFNRGAVVSQIVENIDVMPILCVMAGVALPPAAGAPDRATKAARKAGRPIRSQK